MKIALNTVCLYDMPWQDAIATAAQAGFEDIELLAVENWAHLQPGTVPASELLASAARVGARFIGVHAGGLDATSDETLDRTVAYAARAAELAHQLGAEHLVFTGFPTPAGQTPKQRDALCRRFGAGLATLLPRMADYGIPIALENHYNCQVETARDYEIILGAAGGDGRFLGLTLDTGHFTSSQIDPAGIARVFAARIKNVHVKDHIGTESVGLGQGKTDNASVVRELRKSGYNGYLTVEIEAHDRSRAVQLVNEAKPYMDRLIAE